MRSGLNAHSGQRRPAPERTRPGRASARPDQAIGAVDDAVVRERARTRDWLHETVLQEPSVRGIIRRLEQASGRVAVDSGPGTRLVSELGLGLRLSRAAEAS